MKTMKRLSWLVGVALLGGLMAVPMAAQVSGGIKGKLIGLDGKPAAKTVITFTRTDAKGTFTLKTDKKGNYGYYTLPVGKFNISVAVNGQETVVERGVTTVVGQAMVVPINLQVLSAAENGTAPPPGMTKAEAAAYEAKMKEEAEANKKLGTLNSLLKQNKQFVDAKQYAQAVAVMEQAVTLDQKHDVLFANLAEDYNHNKQYDKAAEAYEKAIALKPNYAGYMINLGTVLSKAGKVDEANEEFAKAAAVDPTQAKMAMYNSGVVLLNHGNMDAAAAAFDKLLTNDPNNADAWYYKGICLLGKATTDPKTNKLIPPPGTVEALQKSLQLAPNGPNAANAKAALQTLQSGQ